MPQGNESQGGMILPRCPHCGESPARILSSPFELGPFLWVTLFCGNPSCAKILTACPVGPKAGIEQGGERVPLLTDPRGKPLVS